jgi:hypothetical protein
MAVLDQYHVAAETILSGFPRVLRRAVPRHNVLMLHYFRPALDTGF